MSKSLSSLLILEPYASGHRIQYVRRIVGEALKQEIEVTVATQQETAEHSVFQQMREENDCRFETLLLPDDTAMLAKRSSQSFFQMHKAQWDHYRAFHRALPSEKRSIPILAPYVNIIDKAVSLFGSPFGTTPWSGIVMRDTFHHPAMGILSPQSRQEHIKKLLFFRLLKNRTLYRLFTIDESLKEYVDRHSPKLASKLMYVPEPVQMEGSGSRADARAQFGIPADAFVVLIYGVMDSRKRVDALLSVLPQNPNLHLLIAGPQSDDVKTLLANANKGELAGRIFQRNDYIMSAEEFAAFRAADAVWLGYRDHYTMSAVLIQCGIMGLPALSCREGLIGWITKRHEIGVVFDAANSTEVQNALTHLMSNTELRARLGQNGKRLADNHAVSAFAQTLFAGIAGIKEMSGTKIAKN